MKQIDCRGFSWRPKVVDIAHVMQTLDEGEQLEIIADQESTLREVRSYVHMVEHDIADVVFHPAGSQCHLNLDDSGVFRLSTIQPAAAGLEHYFNQEAYAMNLARQDKVYCMRKCRLLVPSYGSLERNTKSLRLLVARLPYSPFVLCQSTGCRAQNSILTIDQSKLLICWGTARI